VTLALPSTAQGPPGTGKTRTLLALLEVLSRMSKVGRESGVEIGPILACADTNAATDNILEGLHLKGVNVIRLGRTSAVSLLSWVLPLARETIEGLLPQVGVEGMSELPTLLGYYFHFCTLQFQGAELAKRGWIPQRACQLGNLGYDSSKL